MSTDFRDGQEDDLWEVELSVAHELAADVELDLGIAHQRQDSTSVVDEYTETGATARLQVGF